MTDTTQNQINTTILRYICARRGGDDSSSLGRQIFDRVRTQDRDPRVEIIFDHDSKEYVIEIETHLYLEDDAGDIERETFMRSIGNLQFATRQIIRNHNWSVIDSTLISHKQYWENKCSR